MLCDIVTNAQPYTVLSLIDITLFKKKKYFPRSKTREKIMYFWLVVDKIMFEIYLQWHSLLQGKGRRGRDRMVVGFRTTYAISAYHHQCCEFESRSGRGVQHCVIKFVSDLRQVGGFLRVLRFPPPIKLTTTI
jgi:hypothetical protein